MWLSSGDRTVYHIQNMQRSTSKHYNSQRGSVYFFVMFAIVAMSVSVTAAAKQWKTVVQREKEADLLARGIEIQDALRAYYSSKQKPVAQGPQNLGVAPGWYPLTLEELTKGPKPFLRKVYKDPMTGEDWVYVRDTAGRINGVHSRAKIAPIKQHQFPPKVVHFEGRTQYHDWVFQYSPTSTGQIPQAPPGEEKKKGDELPLSTPQDQPGKMTKEENEPPSSTPGGLTSPPPPPAPTPENQGPK